MSLIRLPFGQRACPRRLKVIHELDELRKLLDGARAGGRRIGLVPTMGNLHHGHLCLVARARELSDLTVASIFVNPFQFGKNEDFDTYPRTFDQDVEALDGAGCDVLFAPDAGTIYPDGPEKVTRVEVPALGAILCGESRPTFFRGVATVVNILFNMVQPDVAMFGEKDYQQLLVIRQMVRDLHMRVSIEAVPTVREADGLAMSSRNNYLDADERARAAVLHATLSRTRDAIRSGATDFHGLAQRALESLTDAGFRCDYFTIRRQRDLSEPEPGEGELIALAAAWMGQTRLIDNVKI
jgi:pantoate--beta-alanine ligase